MIKKTTRLKQMITSPELEFIMEAHSGLSAKLVQEAGFDGVWASSLSISASYGIRDTNEASWTQVLDTIEFMSDATTIPILLDADTGYGNFNNTRRLIQKCEQRDIAGICIEDKIFPKSNSLLDDQAQPLADIDEFAGKIKACKDTAKDSDFVVVARVEAFIAGWGLAEALKRAEAYRKAGADAILMHSKLKDSSEIDAFLHEWDNRLPVVLVPTNYYKVPTEHFKEQKVSVIIWANHNIRTVVTSMRKTMEQIQKDQHLMNVESEVITVKELFRITGMDELKEAEQKYLPEVKAPFQSIILAASQGKSLGTLTAEKPKTLLKIHGKPILEHQITLLNGFQINDITVVRGYKKEMISYPGIHTVDNDEHETSSDLKSLYLAKKSLEGPMIISYGDILFKSYAIDHLKHTPGSIKILVDADPRNDGRTKDLVTCSEPYSNDFLHSDIKLTGLSVGTDLKGKHGAWMGVIMTDANGTIILKEALEEMSKDPNFNSLSLTDLLDRLSKTYTVSIAYIKGGWIGVNDSQDYEAAKVFSC